jgi:SagB-type dehydrogenase family enzyme
VSELDYRLIKCFRDAGSFAPLRVESSLSEIFHENTKLTPLSARVFGQHIASFKASKLLTKITAKPYKLYSLADKVELPKAEPDNALEVMIAARRSQRRFTGGPISAEQLSRLLRFSYGRTDDGGVHKRAVASGGGLYPLEIYVAARRVEGLKPWLYHYDVEGHSLDVVRREDRWPALKECLALQDMEDPDSCAAMLFITAIFSRSTIKYSDRAYRMILMEAGEVGHSLSLIATALGLGGYFLGGFIDDALSDVLDIDGVAEAQGADYEDRARPPTARRPHDPLSLGCVSGRPPRSLRLYGRGDPRRQHRICELDVRASYSLHVLRGSGETLERP